MAKWGFIADLHVHPHGEFNKAVVWKHIPTNSRLVDIIRVLDKTLRDMYLKDVTKVWILGDVFHVKGQVPVDALNLMRDLLFKWADAGLEFHIMTGNHDQADKNGVLHSIHTFQDIPGVTVYSTPQNTVIDDVEVCLIPYLSSHKGLVGHLDRLSSNRAENPRILLAHCGVDGAEIGTLEYRIKDPLTVEDLHPEAYKWVFLGHYHKPQKMAKNVFYVGSPVQHTRAEAGDQKRYILFNTATLKASSIPIQGKEFYRITETELMESDSLPKGYYDITLEEGGATLETIKQKLGYLGLSDFRVIPPAVKLTARNRLKVSEEMSEKKLVRAFVKAQLKGSEDERIGAVTEKGLELLSQVDKGLQTRISLKFLKVEAENFLSLDKVSLQLDRPGSVIAVEGKNLDADGFKSNGAGKSSLLPETLYWCLFGKTARDLPVDKVVNNKRRKNCHVRVEFEVNGDIITVDRYRKHKEHGNDLVLSVKSNGKVQSLSMSTNKDTEAKLASLLGLDYTTFSSVVAFSPETLRFVAGSDSEQKQVLDSILQTDRYQAALTLTKAQAKAVEAETTQLSLRASSIKTEGEYLKRDLEEKRTAEAEFEEKKQEKVDGLKATLSRKQKSLRELKESLNDVKAESQALQTKVDQLNGELGTDRELRAAQSKLLQQKTELETEIRLNKKSLVEKQERLDSVVEQQGKPCPACGQLVTNTSKLAVQLARERSEAEGELARLESRLFDVAEQKLSADASLQKWDKKSKELETLKSELTWSKREEQSKQTQIEGLARECDQLQKTIQQEEEAESPFGKLIEATQTKLRDLKTKARETVQEFNQKLAEKDVLDFWVKGFGNAGVKSFLLDLVIPKLTEYANEYSDALTANSIRIEFSNFQEGAAVQDKFKVTALNSEGSDIYSGNSAGEKRRIDICVMLALFRLANERMSMNVLLLDEVFDTLDQPGIETVVQLLEDLATDFELSIYVTSHTGLTNLLHESIQITKENGLATITQN